MLFRYTENPRNIILKVQRLICNSKRNEADDIEEIVCSLQECKAVHERTQIDSRPIWNKKKTATDTTELATAMSKVASGAASVGSSFESTSAMLATMISVTREAPII